MKRNQSIRIGLLLVVIFAAGIATGRFGAPKPVPAVQAADGREVTATGQLEVLKKELGLDETQLAQFKSILEDAVVRMSETKIGSPERIALFRENVAKLRALLRPEQQTALDRLVQETERRFRQNFRGKNRPRQP